MKSSSLSTFSEVLMNENCAKFLLNKNKTLSFKKKKKQME